MRRLALLLFGVFLAAVPIFSDGHATNSTPAIKFGIAPWQRGQSVQTIRSLYKPLMDWLGDRANVRFVIVGARDYQQMIQLLANGNLDIANLGPTSYVLAKQMNPALELLATELQWKKGLAEKQEFYVSHIVALNGRNDVNRIEDLEGGRFGFVKQESSSGYAYPVALLKRMGIEYRTYFEKHYFLGSHTRVTDAIAAGSIDAGATWDYNLELARQKHGDIFKIIRSTRPIPNLAIVAHPSVPKPIQKRIQDALLDIPEDVLQGLPTAGYVIRPDSFYDVVRGVAGIAVE